MGPEKKNAPVSVQIIQSQAVRRVSTTLRQVFTKFSEVFICCQFSTRKFASGSPRNDDRQIDGPTACPLWSPMGAQRVFPKSIAGGSSVEAGLVIQALLCGG